MRIKLATTLTIIGMLFGGWVFIDNRIEAGDKQVEQLVIATNLRIDENRLSDAIFNTRRELREIKLTLEYEPTDFNKNRRLELEDVLKELEDKRDALRKKY